MFLFVLIYVIMMIFRCTHSWWSSAVRTRKKTNLDCQMLHSLVRKVIASSNCNCSRVVNPGAINHCLLLLSALQIEQQSSHMLNFHNQFSKRDCFSRSCAQRLTEAQLTASQNSMQQHHHSSESYNLTWNRMCPCILQNHCLIARTTHSIVDPLRGVVLNLSCI